MANDTVLVVRLPQSEKDRLQRIADKRGVSLSQYVREILRSVTSETVYYVRGERVPEAPEM